MTRSLFRLALVIGSLPLPLFADRPTITPEEDAADQEYVMAVMDGSVTLTQQAAATSRSLKRDEAEFLEAQLDYYSAIDDMSLNSLEGTMLAFAAMRKQVGILKKRGDIALKAQRRFKKAADAYVRRLDRAPSEIYALANEFERRANEERFEDLKHLYRVNAESFTLQAELIITRCIKIKPEIEMAQEGFGYITRMQEFLTVTYPALEVMTSASGLETEHMIRLLRTHLRDFEKLRTEMTLLRDRLRSLREEDSAVTEQKLQEAIDQAKRDAAKRASKKQSMGEKPHSSAAFPQEASAGQISSPHVVATSAAVLTLFGVIAHRRKRKRPLSATDTTNRYTIPQLRKNF